MRLLDPASQADAIELAAQRLAEEARVQAELASAKSEVARASAINSDMQKSLDTLKSELQRSTGVSP